MSLENFIKFVKEGEAVSSGTPNRPLHQLDQNIKYLWQLIQAAELGSTVYARLQTVASTVELGQPVWFNPATQQFEAALAATETDATTGYVTTASSSQVWGVVAEKHHSTTADILLFGYASVDITAAVATAELNADGSVPAGMWYLSGGSVGKLTLQAPPVSVPVLKTDTNGNVFVNPQFTDFVNNHRHYKFELEMVPAGTVTPPSVGGTHTISAADSSQPGWLPASDAVFDGNAPTGAKFGYNLSQNASLEDVFPPLPVQSAAVIMQRPSVWDTDSSERRWYGQNLMEDLVVVDRFGIWWMSDCYDEVPWPTDYDPTSSESYSECEPAGKDHKMLLYFARVNFATDNSVVSSLNSTDSRIELSCSGKTTAANTGDLDIALNLSFLTGATDTTGFLAFKELDTATGTFNSGPVTEGIYTTSPKVDLVGDVSTASAGPGGETLYQGKVGVSFIEAVDNELSSQLVRLDGVVEQDYPVLYLGFPDDDTATSYVVKFEVPHNAADAGVAIKFLLRTRIIGRAAGTLPALSASYYTTSRPDSSATPPANLETVTQSYTSFTTFMASPQTLVSSNQACEEDTEKVDVYAGDIIYIKIERDSGVDTYTGELGVMQQLGVLSAS